MASRAADESDKQQQCDGVKRFGCEPSRDLKNDVVLAGIAKLARDLLAAIHLPRILVSPEDLPVGGVSDKNFAEYVKAGIGAFGLGSSLYKPGMSATEVAARARATIQAYDAAIQ